MEANNNINNNKVYYIVIIDASTTMAITLSHEVVEFHGISAKKIMDILAENNGFTADLEIEMF